MHDNAQPFVNSNNPYGNTGSRKLPHLAFPLAFVIENFYNSNPKRAKTNKQKPPLTSTQTTVRELALHLMVQRNCTFHVRPRNTKRAKKRNSPARIRKPGNPYLANTWGLSPFSKVLITSRKQQPDG